MFSVIYNDFVLQIQFRLMCSILNIDIMYCFSVPVYALWLGHCSYDLRTCFLLILGSGGVGWKMIFIQWNKVNVRCGCNVFEVSHLLQCCSFDFTLCTFSHTLWLSRKQQTKTRSFTWPCFPYLFLLSEIQFNILCRIL